MKIVVLDGYTTNPGDLPFSGFEALGEVEFYDFTAPEDTVARCEGADIIINNKTVLSRDILVFFCTCLFSALDLEEAPHSRHCRPACNGRTIRIRHRFLPINQNMLRYLHHLRFYLYNR